MRDSLGSLQDCRHRASRRTRLMAKTSVWLLVLLTSTCAGEDTPPSSSVISWPGEDAVLPCRLQPPTDVTGDTLEWARPDLDPRFVFVRHNGKELLTDQNAAYKGRASVSSGRLALGDASLTLLAVRSSDSGRYRCFFPKKNLEFLVDLIVGAISPPALTFAGLDRSAATVLLRCESAGWYPEPELLWLDADGTPLAATAAAPAETLRGPDGLYKIRGRASVQKSGGNAVTCRVWQNLINQSREAQQHLPDDFFITESGCSAPIAVATIAAILVALLVAGLFKRRRDENQRRRTGKGQEVELKPLNPPEQSQEVRKMIDVMKKLSIKIRALKPQAVDEEFVSNGDDLVKQIAVLVEEAKGDMSRIPPKKKDAAAR